MCGWEHKIGSFLKKVGTYLNGMLKNYRGLLNVRANILKYQVDGKCISPREEEILAQGANWEHDAGKRFYPYNVPLY